MAVLVRLLLLACCLLWAVPLFAQYAPTQLSDAPPLEAVRIGAGGKGFALSPSGRPFRVWGVNYDHDSQGEHGRLLEDYWETEWDTVRGDFAEISRLGANVVRVHLQTGRFLLGPDQPNPQALRQLARLLALAEEHRLYLNITGLGCYHQSATPAWYDALSERDRWEAQACFWTAVAGVCRKSNAVFCYDLMNEPILDGKTDAGWLGGKLGDKSFVQRLTLTPGKRTPIEIAQAWVKRQTVAIRAVDPDHLITVGVIPWAQVFPGAKPIFYSPEVAPLLDFVSIHLYPRAGKLPQDLTALKTYAIGKPLVIEETFPLQCSLDEMRAFLRDSRPLAHGYFSFYWGRTADELEAAPNAGLREKIVAQWLREFQSLGPEMLKH